MKCVLIKTYLKIDVDYKGKIKLGYGSRVLNQEWFESNKKRVTCLGFGIHYLDSFQNEIKCLNIDIISDFDGSSAIDLIRAIKYIMNLESFKAIKIIM